MILRSILGLAAIVVLYILINLNLQLLDIVVGYN